MIRESQLAPVLRVEAVNGISGVRAHGDSLALGAYDLPGSALGGWDDSDAVAGISHVDAPTLDRTERSSSPKVLGSESSP